MARYSKHLRESTGELLGAGLLSIRGMMPGDVVDRQLEAEGAANLLAI